MLLKNNFQIELSQWVLIKTEKVLPQTTVQNMYHNKKYKSIKLATLVNERGEQLQFRSFLSFQCLNKSDHNSYATGCVGIWLAPIFLISIPCFIAGIAGPFFIGEMVFDEWMKENRAKLLPKYDIDNYIKLNPDFSRRLYYEKCPEKYLLKYMEKLNPEVVKEIRDSRK